MSKSKDMGKIAYVMPKMSWEEPVEKQMLSFLNHMIDSWERQLLSNENLKTSFFGNGKRKQAEGLLLAYKTTKGRLEEAIKLSEGNDE